MAKAKMTTARKTVGKKKPTLKADFNQFRDSVSNFLMKKFTETDTFNQTVDATLGAMLDLCYEADVFTKDQFEKKVSVAMQTNAFRNIILDCARLADKEKIVERIIHGMANLDIDRDHELLEVGNMKKLFVDKTEDILKLLDAKLADLVKSEEEETNDGTKMP